MASIGELEAHHPRKFAGDPAPEGLDPHSRRSPRFFGAVACSARP
jgi:hypothetical protein